MRGRAAALPTHPPRPVGPTPGRPGARRGRSRSSRADPADRAATTSRRSGEPVAPPTKTGATKPRSRPRRSRPPQARPGQGLGEQPASLPAGAAALRARAADRALRRTGLGAAPRPDQRADPHDPHPEHRGRERRAGVPGAPRARTPAQASRRSTTRARLGRRRAADRRRRPTGRRSRPRRSRSSSTSSAPAAWPQKAPRLQASLRTHPRGARRLLAGVPGRHAGPRGPRLADRRSPASAGRPHRSCCCSASARR